MTRHITLMAADSKPFNRGVAERVFRGCLGVCLGFEEPDNFKANYDTAVDAILRNISAVRTRTVLKSYDFGKLFEEDRESLLSSLGSFVSMLADNEININVVFTTLNTQLIPEGIKKYGTGRYPFETKKPLDFLNELNGYYPSIVTWKVSKVASLKNTTVYLDSFTGEYTKAWGELCAHHMVHVMPKGDVCNPFISSADLVTKYIDEYLAQNHLRLDESSIRSGLEIYGAEDAHIFYVGHPDLENIIPTKKEKINLVNYYKRPMIYICKEGIINCESDFIETSRVWDKLLNFACSKDSGIKFMSYDEDYQNIKDGDYLIYLGEQGEKQAKYLKQLGYDIIPVSSSDI